VVLFLCVLVLIGVCLFFYMLREAFLNQVIEHHLVYSNFPASFNKVSIFFISDIHRRKISNEIINQVNGRADLVVIGGDLTEKGVPIERVKDNLKKLLNIAPVYFVWGNNDYETDYWKLEEVFSQFGVNVLNNKAVAFESQAGERWYLLGVDDLNQEKDRLDAALLEAEDNGFKVLASHYPWITQKIHREDNISLVLSGHTHGGQIHIFGYSPFKRGGMKQLDCTDLLISNGYGTTRLPLRLGAPAESHLVVISNSSKSGI